MKLSIPFILMLFFLWGCESNNTNTSDNTMSEKPKLEYPVPFSKTLEMNGLSFDVAAANGEGRNFLTIQPKGLTKGDQPAEYDFTGKVLEAQITDMDGDNWPEILVITRLDGPSKQGYVVAYTVEEGAQMSEVYFPSIVNDTYYSNGYKGEDQISVVDNYLIQLFPVYKPGDKNGLPTGGTRQLQYGLELKDGKKSLQVLSVTAQGG